MALRLLSPPLIQMAGNTPPTEFRLFTPGKNATRNGVYLFDASAAAAVMAQFKLGGVDLMIDLEHDSLSEEARAMRSDAGDAMGWFKPAVKPDGSLWATEVRWTPAGAQRLRDKSQRYVSPAFLDDEGSVCRLVNVALVAMPATLATPALVAASEKLARVGSKPRSWRGAIRKMSMSPDEAKQAVAAIQAKDSEAALALLAAMLVTAASGDSEAPPPDVGTPPGDDAPELADPTDPLANKGEPTPPAAPGAEPPKKKGPPMADDSATTKAAERLILSVTGAASLGEATNLFKQLSERTTKLDADSAAIELSSRRDLIGRLVKLGIETPATAWAGEPSERKPKKRLLDEPIAELRERVTLHEKAGGRTYEPPLGGGDGGEQPIRKLSVQELTAIKAAGMTEEQFHAAKRDAVKRV